LLAQRDLIEHTYEVISTLGVVVTPPTLFGAFADVTTSAYVLLTTNSTVVVGYGLVSGRSQTKLTRRFMAELGPTATDPGHPPQPFDDGQPRWPLPRDSGRCWLRYRIAALRDRINSACRKQAANLIDRRRRVH
jgi:hypothetical protein